VFKNTAYRTLIELKAHEASQRWGGEESDDGALAKNAPTAPYYT